MAACTICAAASQEGVWPAFSPALSSCAQQGDTISAVVAIHMGKGLQQEAENGAAAQGTRDNAISTRDRALIYMSASSTLYSQQATFDVPIAQRNKQARDSDRQRVCRCT